MRYIILTLTLLTLISSELLAKPFPDKQIPSDLKPWVNWVLDGDLSHKCPVLGLERGERVCAWPGVLQLKLNAKGGSFQQSWKVLQRSWIELPGGNSNWAHSIRVNKKRLPVRELNGNPGIYLERGSYKISGKFLWNRIPQTLRLSPATGMVELNLNGKKITAPERDRSGNLILNRYQQEKKKEKQVQDRLEFTLQRKLIDTIPFQIITRLKMDVSGKEREVAFNTVQIDGFSVKELRSSLPVRFDDKGIMWVQVRPGDWDVRIVSVNYSPVYNLTAPKQGKAEIWVFESQNHLRTTDLLNLNGIDAQQTTIPSKWKQFPAFLLQPGDAFEIKQIKRGNPDPEKNQLQLQRTIWLDFDGSGFTIQDEILGTMFRDWRLEVVNPFQLGRVRIHGKDQFITEGESGNIGVEIRKQRLNMISEARLNNHNNTIPIGWSHNFKQVRASLEVSPGWKVWWGRGLDQVVGSWVDQWTLLDLFMVFLVIVSIFKIWGWKLGLIGLIVLPMTWHEPGAPRWIWLHILIASGLLFVLPEGKLKGVASTYKIVSLVGLLLILVPFLVRQTQQTLYPQLERMHAFSMERSISDKVDYAAPQDIQRQTNLQRNQEMMLMQEAEEMEEKRSYQRREKVRKIMTKSKMAYAPKQDIPLIDPNLKIQTGTGLPGWSWKSYPLRWDGPVEKEENIKLYITSPTVNRILRGVGVVGWLILFLGLCQIQFGLKSGFQFPSKPNWKWLKNFIPVLLFATLLSHPPVAKAEVPSEKMLKELKSRLTRSPDCSPKCADAAFALVTERDGKLVIRLEVHAEEPLFFPVPGGDRFWLPEIIFLDDKQERLFYRDRNGYLRVYVDKGVHQLKLIGPLDEDVVRIPFYPKPRRVNIRMKNWRVSGVHEGHFRADSLHLEKKEKAKKDDKERNKKKGTALTLPTNYRVERTLKFQLEWFIYTKVIRTNEYNRSAILKYPLLNDEFLTTAGIVVNNNRAELAFNAGEQIKTFRSRLKIRDLIKLKSEKQSNYTEVWKFLIDPIWTPTFEGFPQILKKSVDNWIPEWMPWPGEELNVKIHRPKGVPGQTVTIDRSKLRVTPGKRRVGGTLEFSLRSSTGGRHTVHFPELVEMQSISINNQKKTIKQKGQSVEFPIHPGKQTVKIDWVLKKGMKTYFETPVFDLGIPNVNTTLSVQMPQRWTLFLGGPVLGPAVLFWGQLILLIVIAIILGRIQLTPLTTLHWIILALGTGGLGIVTNLVLVGWLLSIGLRQKFVKEWKPVPFNLYQLFLVGYTLIALMVLYQTIRNGLLGAPDMLISGNSSYNSFYVWFQDRVDGKLPSAWILSVPILVYRIAMLFWALWMAFSMIKWLKWGWNAYSEGELWKKIIRPKKKETKTEAPATAKDETVKDEATKDTTPKSEEESDKEKIKGDPEKAEDQ